jgi:hypothetical protein
MTLDVSQLIGSPQVAGVKVRHIGTFRRDAALLGGAVAGVGCRKYRRQDRGRAIAGRTCQDTGVQNEAGLPSAYGQGSRSCQF